MKKLLNASVFSLAIFAGMTFFSCNAQGSKADLKTNIDSVSYAQGIMYSSQVEQIFMQLGLDEANKADFIKGFQEGFGIDPKNKKANAQVVGKMIGHQMGTQFVPYFNEQLFGTDSTQTMSRKNFVAGYISGVKGDTTAAFTRETAQIYTMSAMEAIKEAALEKQYADVKKANSDYLDANKSKAGVITLPSGLQYIVEKEGKGPKPTASDVVKVDYHGTNINGEVFDSSIERGTPAEFGVSQVIKGWTEGLQLMPVGSTYTFYIPYDLAYGAEGSRDKITPFATLIFKVTLLEIVKK
ncbi:peptidyl-prolyl cis-trans isomerase [Bacteroidia bacterium]|nr:peptidyl-prolyl cis-trans isomerase [Bacteroidia bacterium]